MAKQDGIDAPLTLITSVLILKTLNISLQERRIHNKAALQHNLRYLFIAGYYFFLAC
jgi:hypothetical protein